MRTGRVNLFFAGVLTLLVPPLTRIIGGTDSVKNSTEFSKLQGRILFVFAGLNAVAFMLCYFHVMLSSPFYPHNLTIQPTFCLK